MAEGDQATKATGGGREEDPLLGRVINDRFRVVGVIARGGMGKVYRAEQAPLGRAVALKILNPRYQGDHDPEFHKRFFLEASTCSKLTHPNTITIFDYGRTDDDVYYIAMELLEGRTLRQALRQDGPFPPDRALHIARQICRSLREAHNLGVVHRDLKPANVFLVRHGDEDDFVKVLDFGLVKELTDNPADDLTQTGLFMGSPKYMAPEQIRGEEVDGRTDVYALGVLLFEMLTGRVPFDRPNSVNVLMAHVHDAPPSFAEIAPEHALDPELEAVVMRCLAKDPQERFASMGELLIALKEVQPSGSHTISVDLSLVSDHGLPEASSGTLPAQGSAPPPPPSKNDAAIDVPDVGPHRDDGRRRGPALFAASMVAVAAVIGAVAALSERADEDASQESRETQTVETDPQAPTTPAETADEADEADEAPPEAVVVTLRSEPPGALVTIGERTYGPTPTVIEWTGDDARAGREVTFRFHREGYRDRTVTRTLSGPRLEVEAPLDPIRRTTMRPWMRPSMRHSAMREADEPPPVGLKGYKAEPY